MPRAVMLGNGSLTIALDNNLRIRDLFYPHVGLENHVKGHKFMLGVWVEGVFSWVGEDWVIEANYLPETLVSKCKAINPILQIKLEINDAVHSFQDVFLRKILIKNEANIKREIRIFFSHDFHIYGDETGDTALYEPDLGAVTHYKRKRYFLINGETEQKQGFFGYATGQKESFGKEGTWKDAEDGYLSGNLIAQGSVDSSVSFKIDINPFSERLVYYWIACGKDAYRVKELNSMIKKAGVEQLLLETENYWSAWVNRDGFELNILPREIRRLVKASSQIMRTHVDVNGGIVASCDSDILQFNRDTYSYVWPRDGAVCAMAFDALGFQEISRLFFSFCNKVVTDQGYFMHKYWSDGSVGSSWHPSWADNSPQLPIQLDETALVLIALWNHFEKYRDLEFISKVYRRLVVNPTEFLLKFRDEKTGLPLPTFDVWEEKAGVFTATASMVCLALSRAAQFAQVFYDSERQSFLNDTVAQMEEAIRTYLYDGEKKRLIKGIYDREQRDLTVDSTLLMATIYGIFDAQDPIIEDTVQAIEDYLWINQGIGGLARYTNDEYHRVSDKVAGNPWPICTLWLSRWYSRTSKDFNELKKASDILTWCSQMSTPAGLLAEQLHPFKGTPLSVSPLVWSHAEFVLAVTEYLDYYRLLSNKKI